MFRVCWRGRLAVLLSAVLLWGCAGPQVAAEPAPTAEKAPKQPPLRKVSVDAYAAFGQAVLLSNRSNRLRLQAARLRFFDRKKAEEVTRRADELWSQAWGSFQQAVQLDPQGRTPLRYLASALVGRGEFEKAIPYLERLLELSPEDLVVRIQLASLYEQTGRLREARRQYRRLLAQAARSGLSGLEPGLYVQVVGLTVKLEGLVAAAGPLIEALEAYPEAAPVRRAVEEMIERASREEGFIAGVEQAVPEEKRGFAFCYLLGRVAFAREDWETAADYLGRAVEAKPGFWPAMAQWALALTAAGRTDEALSVLKQIPEGRPGPGVVELLRGSVLMRARRYEEARRALEQAVQAAPTNLAARCELAGVYEKLGLLDEAIELLKGNLTIDPHHSDSLNALGYFYAEKDERLAEAEKLVRQALEQEPDNGAYLDSLGWVFFKQGRFQEALRTLLQAADRLADPVIYEHVGDVYRKLDQPAEAVRWWRRALELDPEHTSARKKLQALGSPGTSSTDRPETTHSTE